MELEAEVEALGAIGEDGTLDSCLELLEGRYHFGGRYRSPHRDFSGKDNVEVVSVLAKAGDITVPRESFEEELLANGHQLGRRHLEFLEKASEPEVVCQGSQLALRPVSGLFAEYAPDSSLSTAESN